MCGLLLLASFIWYNIFKDYPCCNMLHSFTWLNNMPLYGYITFCLLSWWTFRLSPHFGCYKWGYIWVQVFVWTYVSFLLCMNIGVELLAHLVTLYNLLGTAKLFCETLEEFHNLICDVRVSNFSIPLPALVIIFF